MISGCSLQISFIVGAIVMMNNLKKKNNSERELFIVFFE
jgi:hypothetical protein